MCPTLAELVMVLLAALVGELNFRKPGAPLAQLDPLSMGIAIDLACNKNENSYLKRSVLLKKLMVVSNHFTSKEGK